MSPRHVSVYHKLGADAQTEFGGIGHEARLRETLQSDWRTIPVMHSAVTLRAERLLALPQAGEPAAMS